MSFPVKSKGGLQATISPHPDNFEWHPVTMRFREPKLELKYRMSYANRSLFVARIAMLFGGFQYLLFAVLDLMLGSLISWEMFLDLMTIRLPVFGSILLVLVWSYRKSFKKYMQIGISIVPLVAGAGLALMILTLQSEETYNQYYVGFILIFIYVHVLLKLRFVYATAVSWFIFSLYVIASISIETTYVFFINSAFFLVSAQFCGMVASYLLEYYDRTVFRQKIILDQRQRELKEKMNRKTDELNEMRNIQLTLLPEQPPCYPDYDIAAAMKTASEVGGDYYDFQLSKDGILTFVIADATGHGAKAGLMVTAAKILFMLFCRQKNLPDTLSRFSKIIKSTGLRQLYISMALGRIKQNRLELAGAGMPAALHWSAYEKKVRKIPLKGMPLGSVTSYPYTNIESTLASGDILFLMSDGLPELSNGNGTMLGYDTAGEILVRYAHQNAQEIIKSFENEIAAYSKGYPLKDDITMIAIKRSSAK